MSETDVLELIPETERPTFARALIKQDRLDAIQLLSDLKYLPKRAFEDGIISNEEFKLAIAQFRDECHQSLTEKDNCSNFQQLWDESLINSAIYEEGKLSQEEILLLKDLTALEGEFVFNQSPHSVSIAYRVAIYRFRIYSLIAPHLRPSESLFEAHINTFGQVLQQYKFEGDLHEFLNILGDQLLMSDFCKNSSFSTEGFIGPIFFFRVNHKNARRFNRLTGDRVRLTKPRDFLDGIQARKLQSSLRKVLSRKPKKQIDNYILSNENMFMLRVLQIKLWVLGLYQGKLDHEFGPDTLDALKQFLEMIFEDSQKGEEDLKNILFVINKDQCLINFQYLLENHIMPLETQDEEENPYEDYYQLLEGDYIDNENQKIRNAAKKLDRELQSNLIAHSQKLITLKKPQRVYKGKRGFKKLISKLTRAIKKVAGKLLGLIRALIKLLAKTIKFIFDEIKEALLTFKRGMSFLFGRRKVSTQQHIITDYDFDFDGHTLFVQDISTVTFSQHLKELQLRSAALYPSIRFVVEVIRWGIQFATGLAWYKILLKMAQLLKDLLLKSELRKELI